MALQYSVTLRNNMLDEIETLVGASATLEIRTGTPPADCATADSGTVVATINLPTDMFTVAAAGAISKNGTWEDTSADSSGIAGHWRIKASGGTCHLQGTAGEGSEDLVFDNADINAGQQVTITGFTITAGNA